LNGVRLLVVKTSSMGDVVHAMPVVSDIRRCYNDARIDWLVEAPFAAIPQMHPGVDRVFLLAWRKWRSELFKRDTWIAMRALRAELRAGRYDAVLDLQGLVKSALWARQAGAPLLGYDRASIREPLAAWAYERTAAVSRELHAVQRCRLLAGAVLGYGTPPDDPDFGLRPPAAKWKPRSAYAVLIPNASRKEKLWPERHWVAVGRRMLELGWMPVVLWGSDAEQTLAERIAAGCEGDVPPFLKVGVMAAVLADANHGHLLRPRAGSGGPDRARAGGQHRRQVPGAFAQRCSGPAGKSVAGKTIAIALTPRRASAGLAYRASTRCGG
jgi:heptosyltransferase-1